MKPLLFKIAEYSTEEAYEDRFLLLCDRWKLQLKHAPAAKKKTLNKSES